MLYHLSQSRLLKRLTKLALNINTRRWFKCKPESLQYFLAYIMTLVLCTPSLFYFKQHFRGIDADVIRLFLLF